MDGSVCPRTKAVPDESDARKVEAALLDGAQRLPVLPWDGNVPLIPHVPLISHVPLIPHAPLISHAPSPLTSPLSLTSSSSLTSPSSPAPRQSAFIRGTCLLLIRKNSLIAKGDGCGSTRALTTSD